MSNFFGILFVVIRVFICSDPFTHRFQGDILLFTLLTTNGNLLAHGLSELFTANHVQVTLRFALLLIHSLVLRCYSLNGATLTRLLW